ncbi:unnamed protein product, partial [Rotaria magnacalcarata]
MNTCRIVRVSKRSRSSKVKPASTREQIFNTDTQPPAEARALSAQSIQFQSTSSTNIEMSNDANRSKSALLSSIDSNYFKQSSHNYAKVPKASSEEDKKKLSNPLMIAFAIGIIIALVALAAMSMGIYSIVRLSQATVASSTT